MESNLKIGLVLPAPPGFSETFFNSKIKGLEQLGHTVVLFVNSPAATETGFTLKAAPKLSGNTFRVAATGFLCFLRLVFFHFKAAKRLFFLNKKDGLLIGENIKNLIANSHILSEKLDWLHFGFGTMALGRENAAAAIGAKMAVSFRGFDFYIYPVKHPGCYEKLFSKEVDYHVLSEEMKADLIKKRISENKITKIPPAINTELFNGSKRRPPDGTLKIATIARLHWKKGLEYTLEALSLLKESGLSFEYAIIGEGPEEERLRFAVHQLGLEGQVVFMGKRSPHEIKTVLENADIYIQYSMQEGFCNAVLEAQAMGKICIVSDADGLAENVLDRQTGFVVPKRNPRALAEQIVVASKMPEAGKAEMSQRAMTRVKEEFSVEKQIAAFEGFYGVFKNLK